MNQLKKANESKNGDPTLSVIDWIGVICCPTVGIILGAIYCKTNKARGLRLIKYSAIVFVITQTLIFILMVVANKLN